MKKCFTRRQAFTVGIGSSLACLGWATMIEPHWLEVVKRDMPLRGLPISWRGKTLLHLSDMHIGSRVSDDWLLSVFAEVKKLEPDIVVYTGDTIDGKLKVLNQVRQLCGEFPKGKVSTYAISGNHDYGKNWQDDELAQQLFSILRDHGIQVLQNQGHVIEGLEIIGIGDLWAKQCDVKLALNSSPQVTARIALAHNPDIADLEGWENFQGWILSGHTHGGQCRPPFLPPPLLPVINRRYVAGEYDLDPDRSLYVNRGIGHLIQARFNVRPEATLFHLTDAG